MSDDGTRSAGPELRPPRLWPAWIILAIQAALLVVTVTPQINNLTRFLVMMAGPAICLLLFVAWLGLGSRLRWLERLAVAAALVITAAAAVPLLHESMSAAALAYGVPLACALVVLGLLVARHRRPVARVGTVLLLLVIGGVGCNVVRMEGFDGAYRPALRWRWQPTSEQMLADRATAAVVTPTAATTTIALQPGDWPEFRGPGRDSRVRGARIRTDWDGAPPRELWRIPVGPAWSSFAHVDGRLFTQEQRGEEELVVCYDAATGAALWRHAARTRFSDVVAGAGPRATPTFAGGRVYTLGAKALLSCLDASSGALIWSRDLMAELGAVLPVWGCSCSPLVVDDHVIVYAGGREDHGLVAYDAASGAPAWHVAGGGMNFASAQVVTIAGQRLVLFTNESGLLAIEPATGDVQWRFSPAGWRGAPMVQPQLIGAGEVILPLGDGIGLARLDVSHGEEGWTVTDRWSSRRLKPSFNDFVFLGGHLFGFDQSNFTCVDAVTGAKIWRGGRYGFGQVLLLEDSAAMIVVSETGDVVLVAADPGGLRELGRIEGALPGKTWNHPIVVGDRLFLRNGEEAACYELALEDPADDV